MKRILCVIMALCMLFVFSVISYGEEMSATEDDQIEHTKDSAIPDARPEYDAINNINITFYIIGGKAYISYIVSSAEKGINISVQLFEGLVFHKEIGAVHKNYSDDKYISGQCVVPVNESGYYFVKVNVVSGEDDAVTKVSYNYDSKIFMGDVDANGIITAADARKILRYSARLEDYSETVFRLGDVDVNGVVTAADARIVLRFAAKLI